jgi:uncharacterized protein YfaS (alpha-2-macroglobulin family)
MKTRLLRIVLAFVLVTTAIFAGPRDAQWQEVTDAINQGLPKTAIERLEPIISAALAEQGHAEAIKAIGQKIVLEVQIQGGRGEEVVTRLQAELAKAPASMKPLMEALLAHGYWKYFQQNRWRILQRTPTDSSPGTDLQTWDLARILAEVDRHFTAALANDAALKATPIANYDELLEAGSASDVYRPTLYDFLAHAALDFYQAGEQASVIREDDFEIDANGPIFADVETFRAWQLPAHAANSPKGKAIALHQALLKFHAGDADRSAFHDVNLARLTFGLNAAVGETKDDLHKAALERFIEATADHEISARALARLAARLVAEGNPAAARVLAQRGSEAYPESAGGVQCLNLIRQIEAPSAQLKTEYVWNAPWPTLDLTYRNVDKVYFRAIPRNFASVVASTNWDYHQIHEERDRLLDAPPALAWEANLPPTSDFKDRTERLPAPATLKPGFYVIVASHDPTFKSADNQISATSIWVSDLALVLRSQPDRAEQSGFVLNAITGEPIAGATVRLWRRDRDGRHQPVEPTTTDENGRFQFSGRQTSMVILAERAGHAVASLRPVYVNANTRDERPATQTVFFTDRALYRPGQTISYKGIVVRADRDAAKYSVIADRKVTVVFSDPNNQEIARAAHTTNDHGSFSGVFTAPRDRLMGQMSLRPVEGSGGTSVRVEEYKRPKFQVKLEAPTDAARLDERVVITGKATAYTGSNIGGARVKWRVERAVHLPPWCWWWQPPASKAIAHGTAVTDVDGSFKLEFPATPDRTVPARNEPVFAFSIHADVTDSNGETRSDARTVRAGYTALQATVEAGEWQTAGKPVEFSISTASLDGDPQGAKGVLKIHALKQPATVARAPLEPERFWWKATAEPDADPTNPDSWELGGVVAENPFATDSTGKARVLTPLPQGIYRASLETTDRFGKPVTSRCTVQVLAPDSPKYGVKIPNHFSSPAWTVEPGATFTALWGTGYDSGRAFVEVESDGKLLKSYWTAPERTQSLVELRVGENLRGGFTVRVTSIRENRAYINERVVTVPWSNKRLSVRWERFRSKLLPGEKETWTAVVTGPDAKRASAEMVATLYDASLDQYLPHGWPHAFNVFRSEHVRSRAEFQNGLHPFQQLYDWNPPLLRNVNWNYRSFPPGLLAHNADDELVELNAFYVSSAGNSAYRSSGRRAPASAAAPAEMPAGAMPAQAKMDVAAGALLARTETSGQPSPDLSKISARTNLSETAFFFPQLIAGNDGTVKMVFTMPEALTEWKLLGFAHDAQLRAGWISDKTVTAKDLMVEPNPPRFLREGDTVEFAVKVSNQSDEPQAGTVRLTFADAATQTAVDAALAHRSSDQTFDVPPKQSRSYSWRISVPDGLGFLTYKAVAASATLSDGEEGFLPVLNRRILVTESLPLPIRGKGTKSFAFGKLLGSAASDTLRHHSLTVQMTSQPAWYAVMALPYLMEYPHECSEQVFNRLYANALARHIAKSDPKIRRIFDLWKNTPALESPLEKNQQLKSLMIEETPWLRRAQGESQARKNVGLLFDANRLDDETAAVFRKLSDQQLGDGLWPWFPGGRPSEYISLYITTGFARLRHMDVALDMQPALKATDALDAWINERFRTISRQSNPEDYRPSYIDALYLYGRSFLLQDRPIPPGFRAAVDFFLAQSRKFWVEVDSRQSQAHLALAFQRFGDKSTAQAIMKSLKERSVSDGELGMFWRDAGASWWWFHAPIETQASMIEAFAEVSEDMQAVEDCKVWLLKQKQTQDWRTTKATADAIYGLLLRGNKLLASDARVEVTLAGDTIKPGNVEAGTGFYEQSFSRAEIKPAMGQITVKKVDDGVSWGAVHWQYLEDVAKIAPHEGTPLRLKKTLWIKETTARGPVLKPATGSLAVGDELVVRIELRTDRDMEFLHLKDQRGSGTEPVNVLSRHRYQDGLVYYESTRDTASHFFIERLPKGTYVFEYSTRVQLRGRYQSGMAEIQCMYAPEFNSHSDSTALEVN